MTRKDYELIASLLAKHQAGEELVNSFASELADTNPRFDRQRFVDAAMPLKHTVYAASAWWGDCDSFVSIVGNDPRKVEKAIYRAMKDAAVDAYNSSGPEDKRKVREYLEDIGWSGVNTFAFASIVPERIVRQYEAIDSNGHVAHHPDMDYSDYESLRDGDKDALVYLPTC